MDEAHFRRRSRPVEELPLFGPGEVAPQKQPSLRLYEVPVGTRLSECRGCRAVIHWIVVPTSGSNMPVDCEHDDRCYPPTATEPGRGVSHFQTCPDADQFSGRGRRR